MWNAKWLSAKGAPLDSALKALCCHWVNSFSHLVCASLRPSPRRGEGGGGTLLVRQLSERWVDAAEQWLRSIRWVWCTRSSFFSGPFCVSVRTQGESFLKPVRHLSTSQTERSVKSYAAAFTSFHAVTHLSSSITSHGHGVAEPWIVLKTPCYEPTRNPGKLNFLAGGLPSEIIGKRLSENAPAGRAKLWSEIRVPLSSNFARLSTLYVGHMQNIKLFSEFLLFLVWNIVTHTFLDFMQ